MTEAAAATPDPEPDPPRTLEALVAAQNVLLGQLLTVFGEANRLARRPMTDDDRVAVIILARRGADIEGKMFEIEALIRKASALRSLHQMREAMAPPAAAEPERPRAGHRKPRRDRPRHLRPAVAVAAAATIAMGGGATGIAMHEEAAQQPVASALGPVVRAAASLPPGSALLVPPASLPHHRAAQDAKTASPAPSPSVSVPVASAPPQPSQSAPAGTLAASTTTLDLGVLGAGSVTLTAEGGPVSWSASQVQGLEVWPSSGTLQAGESVTVSFRATDQSHSGFGIVDLGGGVSVTVSWPAVAGLVQGIASSV